MQNTIWHRLCGETITDLKSTIKNDIAICSQTNDIKFYVGADSQVSGRSTTYVTAIVLYRVGEGGLGYYTRIKYKNAPDIRTRLWNETYNAVTVATWLNEFLKQFGYRVNEVHADLNPDEMHKSNDSVSACLGYICGMGFDGKIKPYSWAASKVANQKTK